MKSYNSLVNEENIVVGSIIYRVTVPHHEKFSFITEGVLVSGVYTKEGGKYISDMEVVDIVENNSVWKGLKRRICSAKDLGILPNQYNEHKVFYCKEEAEDYLKYIIER